MRERRKRVFRDPPVFKGPAKALLLNGVHVSRIWPESFSRRSSTTSSASPTPVVEVPEDILEPQEPPNTTANVPQPLRIPQTTSQTSAPTLVGRLKNPNNPRVKKNSRVTFNMEVNVEGQDMVVPLNCILEEDGVNGVGKRKLAPAQPNPEDDVPPPPPPRLSSAADTTKTSNQSSPLKLLRYENMDSFLQNIQQLQHLKNAGQFSPTTRCCLLFRYCLLCAYIFFQRIPSYTAQ